jgi:hypothetical protein
MGTGASVLPNAPAVAAKGVVGRVGVVLLGALLGLDQRRRLDTIVGKRAFVERLLARIADHNLTRRGSGRRIGPNEKQTLL